MLPHYFMGMNKKLFLVPRRYGFSVVVVIYSRLAVSRCFILCSDVCVCVRACVCRCCSSAAASQ